MVGRGGHAGRCSGRLRGLDTSPAPATTQRLAAVATTTGSGEPKAPVSGGTAVRGLVRGAESAPVPQAAVTLISLAGRQLGRSVAQADGTYAVDAPSAGSATC